MPSRSTKASRRSTPPACSRTCAPPCRAAVSIIFGRREPGHQPDRLRGQPQGQGRAAQGRNPVEGTRHSVAPGGAGRRRAPGRGLSPQRPLRRPRRTEDHRVAEQPRRPRLRDQRRRQDRRQEHRVHRQPLLLGLSPAGRHQDLADRPAGVPADQRHLRSRPDRGRPRAAAPLLSEARLHRRPHRVGGRRIRSAAARASSSPSRSRKASSTASRRSRCSRTCARSIRRCCGRSCGPMRATSTTPNWSKSPSRT